MDTPQQKAELRELVTKLYQECGVEIEPTWPKILVRVLPREQKIGSIWTPDGKQNKPTLEGLVLRVYKPFFQKIYLWEADWVKGDPDPEVKYSQKLECPFQPGDHILFPYIEYGVVPVWPLDGGVGDYRMLPENIVVAKLEYDRQKTVNWLTDVIFETTDFGYDTAQNLLQKADVIRKDVGSLTLSGN